MTYTNLALLPFTSLAECDARVSYDLEPMSNIWFHVTIFPQSRFIDIHANQCITERQKPLVERLMLLVINKLYRKHIDNDDSTLATFPSRDSMPWVTETIVNPANIADEELAQAFHREIFTFVAEKVANFIDEDIDMDNPFEMDPDYIDAVLDRKRTDTNGSTYTLAEVLGLGYSIRMAIGMYDRKTYGMAIGMCDRKTYDDEEITGETEPYTDEVIL